MNHIVSYIVFYLFFILRENDSRFYYYKSLCIIRKRKHRHSSKQTMSSSFSFAVLAKASEARLHRKGMLKKKKKLSLIQEMSSRVHATSSEQILVN